MAHVSESKKKVVEDILGFSKDYPIIGIVNMENLPAPQLQGMRDKLRDKVHIFMTKKRLMKIALKKIEESKKGIVDLEKSLKGMPALLFTKESPFKLSKTLKDNKSSAPAKGGQEAPNDIVVPKGPTPFAPGPIISELASIGIKTGVENGKVAVKDDTVVVRAGEEISGDAAKLLTRLGIEPMEVGLDLLAAYEDGIIYDKKILSVDEKEYLDKLSLAGRESFNLAMFIGYPTKDTIEPLIAKAFNDAKAIGLSENIIDEGIIDELLGKAERSMLSVKSAGNIEVPEKTKVSPEKKPEEKTEKTEEKILEKEKEVIAEEKEIEKEAEEAKKDKTEFEKEAIDAVKETEEKSLENERINQEKALEEQEKKKVKDVDEKVKEMVEETKKFDKEGKGPSAEDILNDAVKEKTAEKKE